MSASCFEVTSPPGSQSDLGASISSTRARFLVRLNVTATRSLPARPHPHLAIARADAGQSIGAQHRAEHMGALCLGRHGVPAVVAHLEPHADHLIALRPSPQRDVEHRDSRAAPGFAPCSARNAGRAKRWNVTSAETGLPGRPEARACRRAPRTRWACRAGARTPQKRCSTPRSASAGFTWSCGPTETPPVTQTTSAISSAAVSAARVAVASSGTPVRITTTAPVRRASASTP